MLLKFKIGKNPIPLRCRETLDPGLIVNGRLASRLVVVQQRDWLDSCEQTTTSVTKSKDYSISCMSQFRSLLHLFLCAALGFQPARKK